MKRSNLKNESASLLQKLIDNLMESSLITKEEILEFLHEKPHNSTVVATLSSCFKESYANTGLLYGNEELSSKLCQKSTKKCQRIRQRKSTYDAGYHSSYSNYSGVLFDEASSMGFDLLKQASVIEGLGKIEENPTYINSTSLQNFNLERPFRENFHETYG